MIPVTPLLSTALATRPGDEISAKVIAELETNEDWQGLAALAAQQVAAYPGDNDWAFILGYARMRAGNYVGAVQTFRPIAEKNPEDIDARNMLGESLRLSGQLDEAARVFERSVANHPTSAVGWFLLGKTYAQSQRLERAKGAYGRAVRIDPENAQSWLGLAEVLARVGPRDEYDEAIRHLQALDPALLDEHRQNVQSRGARP